MSRFTCEICDKTFTQESNLSRHRKDHFNVASSNLHKCTDCGYSSPRKDTFKHHFSTMQENGPPVKKKENQPHCFFCAICTSSFDEKDSVVDHYINNHDISIKIEVSWFWKPNFIWQVEKNEENLVGCAFVKNSSSHKGKLENNITNFFCHRDGQFKPSGKNIGL